LIGGGNYSQLPKLPDKQWGNKLLNEVLSPGLNRLGIIPSYSIEDKNEWSYTSIPLCRHS
jgi:hypothetical protein